MSRKLLARDPSLPARAGDDRLCLDGPERVVALVQAHLARPDGPWARRAEVVFARWKPGVASTALYRVELDDGEPALVTCKRYAGDRARRIASAHAPDARAEALATRLRASAVVADDGLCLYAFPTDRELTGLARVLSLRRTARHWNATTERSGEPVRARHSRATIVRYKPEQRAVVRLDLWSGASADTARTVAARVLAPERALRVAAVRRAFEAHAPHGAAPRLLFVEERTGLIYEEWLAGRACAADEFACAAAAGALLAALHAAPCPLARAPVRAPAERERERRDLAALFAVDPALAARFEQIELADPPPAIAWIHGDFHPDQVLVADDGSAALLDWDALRVGHPVEDLAGWIADALAAHASLDIASAGHDLLAAYVESGAAPPPARTLRETVAHELVLRGAAAIRRLEHDAVARAAALLERAQALAAAASRMS